MKFKNCLVWAIKAKYFHTVLKLINVERLFQNNGIEFLLHPTSHNPTWTDFWVKLTLRELLLQQKLNAELSVTTFNAISYAFILFSLRIVGDTNCTNQQWSQKSILYIVYQACTLNYGLNLLVFVVNVTIYRKIYPLKGI